MDQIIIQLLSVLFLVLQNPNIPVDSKMQIYQQVMYVVQQNTQANSTTTNIVEMVRRAVPEPRPTPTLNFTYSRDNSLSSDTYILRWSSTDASSCIAIGERNDWTGAKLTSGSTWIYPTISSLYELKCVGTGGTVTKSISVPFTPKPTKGMTPGTVQP